MTTAADKLGQAHGREIASTYDALGRLVHWHDSVTGLQETMTYDAVGNRVGLKGSAPNANVGHGTDFDAAGRVVALRENGMVVATYTYDAGGNRATIAEADLHAYGSRRWAPGLPTRFKPLNGEQINHTPFEPNGNLLFLAFH
jgi:YD repeat-containing protein